MGGHMSHTHPPPSNLPMIVTDVFSSQWLMGYVVWQTIETKVQVSFYETFLCVLKYTETMDAHFWSYVEINGKKHFSSTYP
jgi:hypothetical protein